jgi:hypothetical protein
VAAGFENFDHLLSGRLCVSAVVECEDRDWTVIIPAHHKTGAFVGLHYIIYFCHQILSLLCCNSHHPNASITRLIAG